MIRLLTLPTSLRFLFFFLLAGSVACAGASDPSDAETDLGTAPDGALDADADADLGPPPPPFALEGLAPSRGSFAGGTLLTLRGRGFQSLSAGAALRFGDAPLDFEVVDDATLTTVTPAAAPGPLEVELRDGSVSARLPFVVEPIDLQPARAPTAGGTFVTLRVDGLSFDDGASLRLGETPCEDVTRLGPDSLRCRTVPAAAGVVDVVLTPGSGSPLTAPSAFTFYDAARPTEGGASGGPLAGTLTVTVVEAATRLPVEGVLVAVGDDPAAPDFQGATDAEGTAVLSDLALVGPVTLTLDRPCFERTTFVGFDARDLTVPAIQLDPEGCPTPPPAPPAEEARLVSVSGELVLSDDPPSAEAWAPWVPSPTAREGVRVAFLTPSVPCLAPARGCNRLPQSQDLLCDRVSSSVSGCGRRPELGASGYAFGFAMRARDSAALAAVLGLQSDGQPFTPYALAVRRGVRTSSGELAFAGLDLTRVLPLDRVLEVPLGEVPVANEAARLNRYEVRVDLDLGDEGLIELDQGGSYRLEGSRAFAPLALGPLPPLEGPLDGARYRVDAQWVREGADQAAASVLFASTGLPGDRLELGPFFAVPDTTLAPEGEPRALRWSYAESPEGATFQIVFAILDDGRRARWYLPPETREVRLPDLDALGGQRLTTRRGFWAVYLARSPSLDRQNFAYEELDGRRWTGWSVDSFQQR
ncbi:MAG: IPT/TIG domain-containing protein [Myxococcota bacterium]